MATGAILIGLLVYVGVWLDPERMPAGGGSLMRHFPSALAWVVRRPGTETRLTSVVLQGAALTLLVSGLLGQLNLLTDDLARVFGYLVIGTWSAALVLFLIFSITTRRAV